MSQETINNALQKTLISPLTHDKMWSQFLETMSYEMSNMRDTYDEIKNNWSIDKNDKKELIRISESFGYTPNLTIDNTINMTKREIEAIPYKIREKTTYAGYSLIFKQNGLLGDTFNYYWNGNKIVKAIDYEKTVQNLLSSNHYSPFTKIATIKNFSSTLVSNNITLDYLNNGKKVFDEFNIRYYSLDQKFNPFWKLDKSYIKIPSKHLGLEYFPNSYCCEYKTSLGVVEENKYTYTSNVQMIDFYIQESISISLDSQSLNCEISVNDNKEYFIDNEYGIINEDSYFDLSNGEICLILNELPINQEISVSYKINLLMTSDFFYYLEQGMDYNRRCPIIPHSGVFLSADISQVRGSDFYHENENGYTVPDLKLKAITASAYNRHVVLNETSRLDNGYDEHGQPTEDNNYFLDSTIKWYLDSLASESESQILDFKYIACGNNALNVINEKNSQLFNMLFVPFYYNFNSEDDSNIITDNSPNQLSLTVVGDTIKIPSVISKSLNFDGSTYAYSTSSSSLQNEYDYTLGLWFKSTQSESLGTLFDGFINISYDYENEKLIIDSSHEFDCSCEEYHFVCIVFNKILNSADVYKDCEFLGSFSYTIQSISYLIYVGTNSEFSNNFCGEIDNLWLLKKMINSDQMNYIYQNRISLISRMGNRLSYYEIYDDEKYEDDKYSIIQSYVKSMDINNEIVILKENEDENYSSNTKFYPIIPSYFSMNYRDSNNKLVTIQSNVNGEFYNQETKEIVTGGINFKNGSWSLMKNTIKSKSQQNIYSPERTNYTNAYKVTDEVSHTYTWYSNYNISSDTYSDEIIADYINTDVATSHTSLYIYNEENDTSNPRVKIFSSDNEYYTVKNNGISYTINAYVVNGDENENHLFSYDNGKTLYLNLQNLLDGTRQLKSYVDLGEITGTTLYSIDNGTNMYINVECSSDKIIKKWIGEVSGVMTIGYTLGSNHDIFYPNLSFTSTIEYDNGICNAEAFNPSQTVIKSTIVDLDLNAIQTRDTYTDIYGIKYSQSINSSLDENLELVSESITFNYWIEDENNELIKYIASINAEGAISGLHIISGGFDYNTNTLTVTFDTKMKNDVVISYEYYYNLDLDYTKPLVLNYKTEKSIKINEIGLENENHELMAYMTFPDIEFNSIYNNISALFAIHK